MSAPRNLSRSDAYRHDLRGYQTGFILAAILTIVPFVMVASGSLSRPAVLWAIGILGLLQIFVHVRYFLHVDLSPERREQLYLMIFSGSLFIIMIAGMLWIMFNLHTRMM
ncbi:MAG TPA: cytochrome o ubiquinol oxidase subunit IV [Acetobacteraceae bacterium]|nr:cytochrome o ubiquinol oxidase subunit IV [Acetobacteraceae bacterium]